MRYKAVVFHSITLEAKDKKDAIAKLGKILEYNYPVDSEGSIFIHRITLVSNEKPKDV